MSSLDKFYKKVDFKKTLLLIAVLVFIAMVVGVYNIYKPLPEGVGFEGEVHHPDEGDIEFLYDLTYMKEGEQVAEQEIFEEVFGLIEGAEEFVLLDFFLFNKDFGGQDHFRGLTSELTEILIDKKKENPDIEITLITDPINSFYGSYEAGHLEELKDAGVNLITTDLTELRDSNPAYSGFWRAYMQWFGTSGDGWITHPLGNREHKVTLRSILKVLNSKANHRKVAVADNGDDLVSIVTSGNPHSASSMHSNIAFKMKGDIWKDILTTEKAVANFSGGKIKTPSMSSFSEPQKEGDVKVQLLTERKIRDKLVEDINSVGQGDEIDMAMFYLSNRKVVDSLLKASERGVSIRIILDPNKDAFAREKNGIPNRQVAYELHDKSDGDIKIRWYDTRGEQFHTKLTTIRAGDETIIHGGSANLTKRNIGNINLETNVRVVAENDTDIAEDVREYFEMLWNNESGDYTLDFEEKYKDDSLSKYLIYRFQEWSGMSSF